MDKYATLAVCFLLVLSGVTQAISIGYAGSYHLGRTGVGATLFYSADQVWTNNYTISVPDGVAMHLSMFHAYSENTSATGRLHGAIYDSEWKLLGESEWVTVNEEGWFSAPCDIDLISGTYFLACGYDDAKFCMDAGTIRYGWYANGFGFNDPMAGTPDNFYDFSFYFDYSFEEITGNTTIQDVNWMAFVTLIIFALLNVVLMLVPRIYVLNFVVGALTLAFSAATINDSTLPIQPYFSLIVALLATLGILRAANLLRNG